VGPGIMPALFQATWKVWAGEPLHLLFRILPASTLSAFMVSWASYTTITHACCAEVQGAGVQQVLLHLDTNRITCCSESCRPPP